MALTLLQLLIWRFSRNQIGPMIRNHELGEHFDRQVTHRRLTPCDITETQRLILCNHETLDKQGD